MRIFATVKRIRPGTVKNTRDWRDSFISDVREMAGQEIEITPRYFHTDAWYNGVSTLYTFHKSWLKNFRTVEE